MRDIILKILDENPGIHKGKLLNAVKEQAEGSDGEILKQIDSLVSEGRIRVIELDGKNCLYPMGNSSGNKAYFGNEKPKTTMRIKPLIIMIFVGLIIAALVLYTPLTYFFVIGLVAYCIFSWIFTN